ncbi:thiol-disulfide oxidoreductase DCC family protein [Rhizobium tumorigenes]|uniref:thiol-disulfide oxidoreductase DCC family protein n=1 Tax=Rhizobium tumorigenes TaxID=2041385 RepID=UPI0024202F86|nr:DUF393 domain-containing protein [Rhizobium tumorigenes]WFS04598.1 DUF393 domain-containing protein [Rhizobium tumorigenes]
MIKIFYDGACGMCSREINHYRKVAPAGVFDWVDVMKDETALQNENVSLADALMELHGKDDNGRMHVGVDAFLLIWRHIPRWRIAAKIASFPPINAALRAIYPIFAKWRFARLAHCQVAARS